MMHKEEIEGRKETRIDREQVEEEEITDKNDLPISNSTEIKEDSLRIKAIRRKKKRDLCKNKIPPLLLRGRVNKTIEITMRECFKMTLTNMKTMNMSKLNIRINNSSSSIKENQILNRISRVIKFIKRKENTNRNNLK